MVRTCFAAFLCLGFSAPAHSQPYGPIRRRIATASPSRAASTIRARSRWPICSTNRRPRSPSSTGHGTLSGSFTGVSLWTLLQEAGVTMAAGKKNDVIHHTVTVTGGDGYEAVLSLAEIAPEFGGDQAIVAWQQDGKALAGGDGFARLIIPGDKAAGRAVGAVTTIEVK